MTAEREPITLAICSNRSRLLSRAISNSVDLIRTGDGLLVLVDGAADATETSVWSRSATVLVNGVNRGLAYSRNRVLKECETRFVIFLDDDVTATREAVESARASLLQGADVVGARIVADLQGRRPPWHLSAGQLHYLGSHNPATAASIWGGFFGIDIERARLLSIEFDEQLGRTQGTLGSAEDTTFVRAVVASGGRIELLNGVEVGHLIEAHRLTLAYLLRRAFWQGRSERRRQDALRGLRKEIARNWQGEGSILRRAVLTMMYSAAVIGGIAREGVTGSRQRRQVPFEALRREEHDGLSI